MVSPIQMQEPAVLVSGGAGLIGKELVRSLSDSGKSIVTMYHHRLPEANKNVYPFCSDMGSVDLLSTPLRGVNVVCHLAWGGGLNGPRIQKRSEIETGNTANLKCLQRILKASEKAEVKRFVFMSALGAS